MSVPRYPITLTKEERERLTRLIRTGKSSAYEQIVARVLLNADRRKAGAARRWRDCPGP